MLTSRKLIKLLFLSILALSLTIGILFNISIVDFNVQKEKNHFVTNNNGLIIDEYNSDSQIDNQTDYSPHLSSLPETAYWAERNESLTGRIFNVFDIDEDKIPELMTITDTNGHVQEMDEPGYTKFLEYNSSAGTFSNELISLNTDTTTAYYPVEAYATNEKYFLEKRYTSSTNYYIWKEWNGTTFNTISDTYIKSDGLYDWASYDFDVDGNVDLVCNWGYYAGKWTRLELESGIFSSTDYSFYNGGRSIFVNDLDNDGNPNVAVLYAVGKLNIYNYNPVGDDFTFQQQIQLSESIKAVYPSDYDHNGYNNIMFVCHDNNIIIYSYEWDPNLTQYVQKLSYTIPGATGSQWTGVPRFGDLLGDGEIRMVFDIVKDSHTELGYISYENGNFNYEPIYIHPDDSKVFYAMAQIDNDAELEVLVNYDKGIKDYYTKVLDLVGLNESRYYETFDNDVFSTSSNLYYSWQKSSDSVTIADGLLKILADGENDDYVSVNLSNKTKSIQIRARVTSNGDIYNYPEIVIKDNNNQIISNITFSQTKGWNLLSLDYLSDFRGPTEKNLWYDFMINFGENSLTISSKKPYQHEWRYIGRQNITGNIAELVLTQRYNAEIEIESIDIFYEKSDTDFDGLYDDDELNIYDTDPNDSDTDDDAFSDGFEIEKGTDPLEPLSYPKLYSTIFSDNFEAGTLNDNTWSAFSSTNDGEWTVIDYKGNYWVQHLYSGTVTGHTDGNLLVTNPLNFGDNFSISYVVRPLTYQHDEVGITYILPNGTGFRLGTFDCYNDNLRIGNANSYYDFAFSSDLDTTYNMKVTYVDNTITVYSNGSQIAQVTNCLLPSDGLLGLRSRGYYGQAAHVLYDNITIQSATLIKETFDFDIFDTYSNWIRDSDCYTVDTSNGWLHKAVKGANDDYVKYNKTIQFPFTVTFRGRLVSGGRDYTSPDLYIYFPNG
ncbi:MAG: hypothetical protein ACTSPI_13970, partial [Candidatus Heimdallarchaeaceae archaeon]